MVYVNYFAKTFSFENKSIYFLKVCCCAVKKSPGFSVVLGGIVSTNSVFSQAHKIGLIGITANFVFPYIYLHFLPYVKLDVSG